MTWRFLFTSILFSGLIFAGICAFHASPSASPGEEGDGDVLLSAGAGESGSPRAVFDALAKRMGALKKTFHDLAKEIDQAAQAKKLKPMATVELVKFLEEEAKESTFLGDEEGDLTFEREEKLKDGRVRIHGKHKAVVRDIAVEEGSGEQKVTVKEVTRKSRFDFIEREGQWRIEKWFEQCSVCDGTGRCDACGGTGKTKPETCFGCEGTGKMAGETCELCGGTGKTKPEPCTLCAESGGRCMHCKGEKWTRQDEFLKPDFLLNTEVKVKETFDLSSPEKAARTYLCIRKKLEATELGIVKKITMGLREILRDFFVPEALERFEISVQASDEMFKAEGAAVVHKVAGVEQDGDKAVVILHAILPPPNDKEAPEVKGLRFVKKGAEWRLDDLGDACWGCEGTGKCGECKGTGTTPAGPCWSCEGKGKDEDGTECPVCGGSGKTPAEKCVMCEETKGKCPDCKGERFTWKRSKRKK